jgi:hypothetical protein
VKLHVTLCRPERSEKSCSGSLCTTARPTRAQSEIPLCARNEAAAGRRTRVDHSRSSLIWTAQVADLFYWSATSAQQVELNWQ